MVFLSQFTQMPGWHLKLGYDHVILYRFQFIIHQSCSFITVYKVSAYHTDLRSAASKPSYVENIRYVIIMISGAQFIIGANYASAFKDEDLNSRKKYVMLNQKFSYRRNTCSACPLSDAHVKW
jgi:hypothetical protein